MNRRLETRHIPARQVPPDLLRALWRIRHDFFPVDEGRTEDEDYGDFAEYFSRERRDAIVFFDRGKPVGFYVNSHDEVVHEGRRAVLISIEYTYMLPAYRGHPAFILAGFRMFLRLLLRNPLTPIYYVGYVLPNSFAFVRASFARTFTLQERPPPFERALLLHYARAAGGTRWDEARQVAHYQNRPPRIDTRAHRSPELAGHHATYERLVPTWRDGDALVILAPADRRAFGNAVRRAAKRLWREIVRRHGTASTA